MDSISILKLEFLECTLIYKYLSLIAWDYQFTRGSWGWKTRIGVFGTLLQTWGSNVVVADPKDITTDFTYHLFYFFMLLVLILFYNFIILVSILYIFGSFTISLTVYYRISSDIFFIKIRFSCNQSKHWRGEGEPNFDEKNVEEMFNWSEVHLKKKYYLSIK